MRHSLLLPPAVAALTAVVIALDPRAALAQAADLGSGILTLLVATFAAASVSAGLASIASNGQKVLALEDLLPVTDWSRVLRRFGIAYWNGIACGIAGMLPLLVSLPRSIQSAGEVPAILAALLLASAQGSAVGTLASAAGHASSPPVLRAGVAALLAIGLGWLLAGIPQVPQWLESLSLALPVPQALAAAAGRIPVAGIPATIGMTLLLLLGALQTTIAERTV